MKNIFKLLLLFPYLLIAQSQEQNYVKTKSYKVESQTSIPDSEGEKVKVEITYFDGLGRPIQHVGHRQSSSGNDLITHISYDILGREDRKFLPFAKSGQDKLFDANAEANTLNFPLYSGHTNPYTKTFFEKSPLNRILKESAPGTPWIGNESNDNDRAVKYTYDVNSENDKVQDFTLASNMLASGGYSPTGKLYKTVTKDENWTTGKKNTTEEFKDYLDRMLLKRVYESETSFLDTYYVYDSSGNLAFIIPPLASGIVATTTSSQLPYSYYQEIPFSDLLLSYNGGGGGGITIENNTIKVHFNGSFVATQINVARSFPINASQPIPNMTIGTFNAGFGRYTVIVENNQLKFIDNYPNSGNYTSLNHTITAPLDTSTFGGQTVYNTVINQSVVSDLCYQFKYDGKSRLIEKKVPGRQWEYTVYDKLDRIIATSTASSPFSDISSAGWHVNKYDVFDRPILTGWIPVNSGIDSSIRQALQAQLNAMTSNFSESKSASDSNINGIAVRYTNQAFPVSGYHVLSVIYYDDYVYPNAPTDFSSVEGQEVYFNATRRPKGLQTGIWTRALQTSNNYAGELYYMLYDYKERAIRTKSINYLGGHTTVDSKLIFSGKPDQTLTIHARTSSAGDIKIYNRYKYTAQERLYSQTHEIAGQGAEQLLSLNSYDELGQLISKRTGGIDLVGNACLQKIDYRYNIRGWLTDINSVNNFEDETISNKDLFAYKLNYWDVGGSVDSSLPALFNGNISQSSWVSRSDLKKRNYTYRYDPLNRLRSASYFKSGRATRSYDESMEYDKNGNILRLKRFGDLDYDSFAIEIDDLEYSYDSQNRLKKVKDNTDHPAGFKDGSDMDEEFRYDLNGNMNRDENKGIISISHNHMDLPLEMVFRTGERIIYLYDATGKKLKKTLIAGSTTTETDYLSGFQYVNGKLEFFPTTEGYVKATGTSRFGYVFNYVDHLGNLRMSYGMDEKEGKLVIMEENHYYPFGLKHEKYNSDKYEYVQNELGREYPLGISPLGPTDRKTYQYKYSGKEFQDEAGLNMYDMEARNYMPDIGRWGNIDKLTDSFADLSAYAFSNNSPLNFSDPTGLAPEDFKEEMENDIAVKSSPEHITSTVVNTQGKIIDHKNDGDDNIYLGSRKGTVIGKEQKGRTYIEGHYLYTDDLFGNAQLPDTFILNLPIRRMEFEVSPLIGGVKGGLKYLVYLSRGAKGVKYVGITSQFAVRQATHLRTKGIMIEKLLENLSKADARAVEQVLIEMYKLPKNGGTLMNKINSISTKNPGYGQALERGAELLKEAGLKL
ncbi:MAG: hypothetical protein KAF41_11160 [Flavobacterium sp.]|nr:hypothetical protein [Flavobacterium sp.]PZO35027.1 MAG: hypothetical protein DCE86_00015 [Flavobacteriaceae bacterium]